MGLGKGKFDGVLLATDFDDTYCPESGIIPPANLEAVAYFKANGGRFTVSTGRARATFAPYLDKAPVNAPVILSNGAQLYDFVREEMVVDITLPACVREDMAQILSSFPRLGMEAYHGEEIYLCNPNPWTGHHMRKVGSQACQRPVEEMPLPWGKAIFLQDEDLLLPARDEILSRWGDRYEAIFSNSHMLEITRKGSNKGSMVRELARRLNIRPEHIYCAGDNQNDIPMLAVSAIPFAPADCAQAVKDWGAALLPPCEEGAIARLIEILDQRY